MRKILFCFALVLWILPLFSSCAGTYKAVLDENSPVAQNVVVTFKGHFVVREWNNIDVEERIYGRIVHKSREPSVRIMGQLQFGDTELTVPAGNNRFLFDVSCEVSTSLPLLGGEKVTYNFNSIELPYNLEAGKKYEIRLEKRSIEGYFQYEFFIELHDVTRDSTLLREWRIGETKRGRLFS